MATGGEDLKFCPTLEGHKCCHSCEKEGEEKKGEEEVVKPVDKVESS